MSCFLDDRVDGECEKNRTWGVPLLNAPCAGNNLRSDTAGASEEGALVTVITAIQGATEGKWVRTACKTAGRCIVLNALETSNVRATLSGLERWR